MPVAAIAAETLFVPDLTLAREHLAITIILGGLLTSCQSIIGKFFLKPGITVSPQLGTAIACGVLLMGVVLGFCLFKVAFPFHL